MSINLPVNVEVQTSAQALYAAKKQLKLLPSEQKNLIQHTRQTTKTTRKELQTKIKGLILQVRAEQKQEALLIRKAKAEARAIKKAQMLAEREARKVAKAAAKVEREAKAQQRAIDTAARQAERAKIKRAAIKAAQAKARTAASTVVAKPVVAVVPASKTVSKSASKTSAIKK